MRFAVVGAVVSLGLLGFVSAAGADEEEVPLKDVPKAVLDAVKARFPGAELKEAVKESEDGTTTYEVALKDKGKAVDVALTAEGKVIEIETEVAAKDLPKAVSSAIEAKYPKASVKKAVELIEFEDGEEEKTYEVQVVTADGEAIEVSVDEDGEIEDDGEDEWTADFASEKADLVSTGRNPYFVLEPGYQLVFEGGKDRLTITVLDETKTIDGVET
ncbi:MAG: PepSY-like domain-containing protein, partial [Singulisphaera sp.]